MVAKMSDLPSTTSVSAPTSPTPHHKRSLDIREFAGNAKRITVECNRQHLRISGNGNKVYVACNAGRLEVLGNGNRIKILDNTAGKVNIVGNNTKVYLSSDTTVEGKSHTNVRFTGLNGSVKMVSADELRKKSHPSSPTLSNDTAAAPTAPSSSHHHQRCHHHDERRIPSDDELFRRFEQQRFRVITDDCGISVNSINVSLDSLPTNSHLNGASLSSIHIGSCRDVRLDGAVSCLVINQSN